MGYEIRRLPEIGRCVTAVSQVPCGVIRRWMLGPRYTKQCKDGRLHNTKRKGKKTTKRFKVSSPARWAVEDYFEHERGRLTGTLFQTKNGQQLAAPNLDSALKAIAAQANATLPKSEQIHLSAHMLRHNALPKSADKDIRYAMKLSGHSSTKYIWRYTEPGQGEFDAAIDVLFN